MTFRIRYKSIYHRDYILNSLSINGVNNPNNIITKRYIYLKDSKLTKFIDNLPIIYQYEFQNIKREFKTNYKYSKEIFQNF